MTLAFPPLPPNCPLLKENARGTTFFIGGLTGLHLNTEYCYTWERGYMLQFACVCSIYWQIEYERRKKNWHKLGRFIDLTCPKYANAWKSIAKGLS